MQNSGNVSFKKSKYIYELLIFYMKTYCTQLSTVFKHNE